MISAWLSLTFPSVWKEKRFLFAFVGFVFLGFFFAGVGYFRLLIDLCPFFWNVLYLPLTSVTFSLFLPILSQWNSESNRLSKSVTLLSKISYAVYLLNYGIVLQLMKYFIPTDELSIIGLHEFTFCYMIITFMLSYLVYHYFEKPIMDLRDRNS